jgi:hypothetical protein
MCCIRAWAKIRSTPGADALSSDLTDFSGSGNPIISLTLKHTGNVFGGNLWTVK